ncbi:hypothetical protein F2Q68_00006147 [Brassica cretica]|uniref:Uncharacterized protein n=1 Tax=Brassica cretica TaxID=69181 RepID=A0A8S9JFU0_BRACR|nr:hypothetical protein F2Q68_00006147 [Brassica cretica]
MNHRIKKSRKRIVANRRGMELIVAEIYRAESRTVSGREQAVCRAEPVSVESWNGLRSRAGIGNALYMGF